MVTLASNDNWHFVALWPMVTDQAPAESVACIRKRRDAAPSYLTPAEPVGSGCLPHTQPDITQTRSTQQSRYSPPRLYCGSSISGGITPASHLEDAFSRLHRSCSPTRRYNTSRARTWIPLCGRDAPAYQATRGTRGWLRGVRLALMFVFCRRVFGPSPASV